MELERSSGFRFRRVKNKAIRYCITIFRLKTERYNVKMTLSIKKQIIDSVFLKVNQCYRCYIVPTSLTFALNNVSHHYMKLKYLEFHKM